MIFENGHIAVDWLYFNEFIQTQFCPFWRPKIPNFPVDNCSLKEKEDVLTNLQNILIQKNENCQIFYLTRSKEKQNVLEFLFIFYS